MALLLPLQENDEQTLLRLCSSLCVGVGGETQREHLSKRPELLSHCLLKFQRLTPKIKTRHHAKEYLLALASQKWLQGFCGVCYPQQNNIRKRYRKQEHFSMISKQRFAKGGTTVCVSRWWAGVDNAWEQEKPEARKMPVSRAAPHQSAAPGHDGGHHFSCGKQGSKPSTDP